MRLNMLLVTMKAFLWFWSTDVKCVSGTTVFKTRIGWFTFIRRVRITGCRRPSSQLILLSATSLLFNLGKRVSGGRINRGCVVMDEVGYKCLVFDLSYILYVCVCVLLCYIRMSEHMYKLTLNCLKLEGTEYSQANFLFPREEQRRQNAV